MALSELKNRLNERMNKTPDQSEDFNEGIKTIGIFTNKPPGEARKEEKVAMMPADGQPHSTLVEAHELGLSDQLHGGTNVFGSQLNPALVTRPMAALLEQKGWIPHQPREVMSLEETQKDVPKPVTMMAPDRSFGTAEAERPVGPSGLYPCVPGEEIQVEPQDVDTLRAKGWGVVYSGTAFPQTAEPGARFKDTGSGRRYIKTAAGWEPQAVFYDGDEAA